METSHPFVTTLQVLIDRQITFSKYQLSNSSKSSTIKRYASPYHLTLRKNGENCTLDGRRLQGKENKNTLMGKKLTN